MFLPPKTSMKRAQHCRDSSLVAIRLFAMSTTWLWADTYAFPLLLLQNLSPGKKQARTCILIIPVPGQTLSALLSLTVTQNLPPSLNSLSVSAIPSGFFFYFIFVIRHDGLSLLTVRTDLRHSPSL
ncbi:hypothetical protein XENOCAPTIV_017078 [Xenoophorus captivus]|uniref:Uncharacterized protein n=1 Tax=Xenoophorus captivus TaxID=1517983 RepID=A0ABV0QVQ7_9TELE